MHELGTWLLPINLEFIGNNLEQSSFIREIIQSTSSSAFTFLTGDQFRLHNMVAKNALVRFTPVSEMYSNSPANRVSIGTC